MNELKEAVQKLLELFPHVSVRHFDEIGPGKSTYGLRQNVHASFLLTESCLSKSSNFPSVCTRFHAVSRVARD